MSIQKMPPPACAFQLRGTCTRLAAQALTTDAKAVHQSVTLHPDRRRVGLGWTCAEASTANMAFGLADQLWVVSLHCLLHVAAPAGPWPGEHAPIWVRKMAPLSGRISNSAASANSRIARDPRPFPILCQFAARLVAVS